MKTNSPTHEEIARYAYEIWRQTGSPDGRDNEIWLDAERQLKAGRKEDPESDATNSDDHRVTSESKGKVDLSDGEDSDGDSDRAATAVVEHNVPTPFSDNTAATAEQQRKEARAPRIPPANVMSKAPLAATGKPLWNQPHSS